MTQVKFYQGYKTKYDSEKYKDGIYFAVDEEEIILNGKTYNRYPSWEVVDTAEAEPEREG